MLPPALGLLNGGFFGGLRNERNAARQTFPRVWTCATSLGAVAGHKQRRILPNPDPNADLSSGPEQDPAATQLELREAAKTELVPSPQRTEYLIVRGRRDVKDGRSRVSLQHTTITTSEFDDYEDTSRFAPPPEDASHWQQARDRFGWNPHIESHVREPEGQKSKVDDDQVTLADVVAKLRRAWSFTRRYGLAMVIAAMLGAGLGAWSYLFYPPASTAFFRIRLIPEASENPLDPYRPRNLEFFSAAQRNFTGEDLVKKTLVAQGDKNPSEKEVDEVREHLAFDQVDSEVYEGRYARREPADGVVGFLGQHLDLYLQTEIQKAIHTLQAEVDWLKGKLKVATQQLRADEAALMAFKQEHIDELPGLEASHQAALLQMEEQERALRSESERSRYQLEALSSQLESDRPLRESRASAAAPYRAQVAQLQQALAAERTAGKADQHPDVVALVGQLKTAQARLDDAVKNGDPIADAAAGSTYRDLERTAGQLRASSRAASAELARLAAERRRLEKLAEAAPEIEFEFIALKRAVEASDHQAKQLHDTVTKKEMALNMEREKSGARYEILEEPQEIQLAPWKVLMKRCILGGIAGFLLGLMFGLARDLFRRIRSHWHASAVPPVAPGGVPARRGDGGRSFMALPPAP